MSCYFAKHFLQIVKQCFRISLICKCWNVQLSVVYRDLVSWNQAKIKSCVSMLVPSKGQHNVRAVSFHCQKNIWIFSSPELLGSLNFCCPSSFSLLKFVVTFLPQLSLNFVRLFVPVISRTSSNMGHLRWKTWAKNRKS
jgi:hypothetical protein